MGKQVNARSQSEKHPMNNDVDENGVNLKSKSTTEIPFGYGVSPSASQSSSSSSGGQGISRRKALYVSSTIPTKNQAPVYSSSPEVMNGSSITANNTVTGIYNYDSNNWDELSSNARNNFMSLDRHMNLPNYSQTFSPPGTPPPYSTASLGRNSVPSLNQYQIASVPITIAQNNNISNSQVCVSPNMMATSPNIIATSPNMLATSPNILATSPSYFVINNNPSMEASPVLSPTNYNIVEDSTGRRLSNPARPGSLQINGNYTIVEDNNGRRLSNASQPGSLQVLNGNYNIVEDNNGRRLSNPSNPGSLQISNGNLYLQNAYPSSNMYGSSTSSPPGSPQPQNIMYSLPRNFSTAQNIPFSQSPSNQNPGGVQIFKKSQSVAPNQRYSLPVINSYPMINPNLVTKSNTVDYRSNNTPVRHSSQHIVNPIRQHNTLSLSESNNVRNSGLSINGKNTSNATTSPLMEATTRSRAKSNSFSVKIPQRKDSTCLVGSLNSSGSSFILDNSKSGSIRNVNPVPNLSSSIVSNSSSQGSGKVNDYSQTKVLPDNINDPVTPVTPITPKGDGPSTENIISQPIDIPTGKRDSDSDSDSSFSSYRSSNYVMSITQGEQTESTYSEVHPRPPPYEHSFMDQDSYDMDNDHDLIFDLEHTASIPRSNSDENKEIMEGMPILFNNRRRSRDRPLFDHELINNDTLTSSTAFSNLLDSYTKILNSFESDARQAQRKGNEKVEPETNTSTENDLQRKESDKVKRNSSTILGVDVEVAKEILRKRSTLKTKDRVVADEILRKISISHAKSIKKEPSLVKKSSTRKSGKTVETVARENTLNQNDLSLSSSKSASSNKSPKNNLEEKTVYVESTVPMIPEAEAIVVQPVQVLADLHPDDIPGQSILDNPNTTEGISLGNEKDDIDIGLDIFDRFYEECLKRIDSEEATEGSEQEQTLKKNKKSMENVLSLDRNNSIIDFDDELKGNFLSGLLFSNSRSSPSLENIKSFLQGDSLTEGQKGKSKIETEEAILQPTVLPTPVKVPSVKTVPVQRVENCVDDNKKKESSEVAVVESLSSSSSSPELVEQSQSSKQKQVPVPKEIVSEEIKQEPKENAAQPKAVEIVTEVVSKESVTESNPTVVTEVPVVEKESSKVEVQQKEETKPSKPKHPLPSIPVVQKKVIETPVEAADKEKDIKNVEALNSKEVEVPKNVEALNSKEVEVPKNVEVLNSKEVEVPKNVEALNSKEVEVPKTEVKEEESKSKEETTGSESKEESKPKEDESKEGENKKDGSSISSSDSIKKIETILKKNSDRGKRIILPQYISDINNENKNEEPFIPNKTEVKQLIDRNLSNSSSHNFDNTQFFWSSDVQANTEVHPSEIFNHSNSVPEKLLGTIPTRKKSFAESAYVITRDSISNDINGKPVIDPKNYIRYRRSRVIWEHYNNSYLQHRMMSWSSNAIIRSKTIGSCYIKPQHSPSVSVVKNMPIRSHTTEAKTKLPTKGPVTNYYEYLTPSIEALKEDNEMLTKVVNDMIKKTETDSKTSPEKKDEKEDSTVTPKKEEEEKLIPEVDVSPTPVEEKQEQEKPINEETKLPPKKVQINEDNNQVVSTSNDEIITSYIPSDSSLSYSKTIYEYTTDEDLEKIVEENSKAKRSGWAIWWSNYASQEDANNRLKEQKQMNEDKNKNLLKKIRHFGNKNKKHKKQKKRNKDNEGKSSSPITPVTPSGSDKSSKRESLPIPRRQSSISRKTSKSQKKHDKKHDKKEEKKEENEEVPYTQTLTPSPLLSPQIIPVGKSKKNKKSKSKLNEVIENADDNANAGDDEMGYSSDTSFSSISSVSSISSLSINEQLGNQPDLLPLANTSSNKIKEIFHDQPSDFSDFASSPGSPLFSNVHREFPSPKDFVPVGLQSPSISSSLPEDLILPSDNEDEEPKEIFSEKDLLAPDERDLLADSSQFQELNNTNNQIYDLANVMSTPSSGITSAQPLFTPPPSASSPIISNFDLDNEKFNAISRDLQKKMEAIYHLQLTLQQQFEQISIKLQEHQRANDTILQEEMEAIKKENEWRQNCIQQQKIIRQKQIELQDKQRKLQIEQETLLQKQLQQQEIHRQEQELKLQELQLSQLRFQLKLQEQIKEQLHRQQLQSVGTEATSSYYEPAIASPNPTYSQQDMYQSNIFDEEINAMLSHGSSQTINSDQIIPDPDFSNERMDINELIEANCDSDDSFTNNSDYYYSDITSNSEFTDTTYDSTGSEYSFNKTYNDRLHIYKPEDDLPYARFNPLVEKALYHLSWNKLSYTKRSLHQQVIIRNLMIYYFTLNMESSGHSRKSSMRRHVPRIKGVGRKRSRSH